MGNKAQKKPDLYDISWDLKSQAKQMEKQCVKMEKGETANRKKIIEVSLEKCLRVLITDAFL